MLFVPFLSLCISLASLSLCPSVSLFHPEAVILAQELVGPFTELTESHFGKAIRCTFLRDGISVDAVVKAPLEDKLDRSLMNEWLALSRLPFHPNLLKFFGFCERFEYRDKTTGLRHRPRVVFVTPFMNHGSIVDFFSQQTNQGKAEHMLRPWALDIAKGLAHLHANRLVHRDLAARNVFINADQTAVVGDFGLLRSVDDAKGRTYVQTSSTAIPLDVAPETMQMLMFSPASDIYSFGLTLFEIATECTKFSPFP